MTRNSWMLCVTALAVGAGSTMTAAPVRIALPGYPTHLHYAVAPQQQSRIINALVAETLVATSPRTGQLENRLAKNISVEKSDLAWIIELNPQARFHDGEAVKASDVLFSWDLIFAPGSKAQALKTRLENWERPERLRDGRLRFKAREKRFGMLETLVDFYVLSEKAHAATGYSRTQMVGSGPYVVHEIIDGTRVSLLRNDHYWAERESWTSEYPTGPLEFTVETDPRLAWEKTKQGQFDYLYALSSGIWTQNIVPELATNPQLAKIEHRSKLPAGVAIVLWNQRHPVLAEKDVRCGLQALMDRQFWMEKIFASAYDVAEGLFPTTSPAHAPELRVGSYAPEKAQRLFEGAGWRRGKDGYFAKAGRRLSFEMLLDNPASERLFSVYQDELRRGGVEMKIRVADWASVKQRLQNHQFDAALSYRPDPGLDQLDEEWGSRFADIAPSLNRTGFRDADVDRWLKTLHTTFSEKKRQVLYRNIERHIVESCTVGLGWENGVTRLVVAKAVLDPSRPIAPYADWTQAFWTLAKPTSRMATSEGARK